MTSNHTTDADHPLGYWLKAVDRLLAAEFEKSFAQEGLTRRDWRILNRMRQGDAAGPAIHPRKLRPLVERGWVAKTEGQWALTQEGEAAYTSLSETVQEIRVKVADNITAEEMDTTLASLKKMASSLGWNEGDPLPQRAHREQRGHRFHRAHRAHREAMRDHHLMHARMHGRGFGPMQDRARGRSFGPGEMPDWTQDPGRENFASEAFASHHSSGLGEGFDPRPHFNPADRIHPRWHRGGRRGMAAQSAYERGFDAGFSRGQRPA